MKPSRVNSIVLAALLVMALAVLSVTASGCGSSDPFVGSWGTYGMLRIEKSGDTYLIHDPGNPFGSDYQGTLENGKLVAKDGVHSTTFTIEGDWLVEDGTMRFEKN